jgi:hypothetical protein
MNVAVETKVEREMGLETEFENDTEIELQNETETEMKERPSCRRRTKRRKGKKMCLYQI